MYMCGPKMLTFLDLELACLCPKLLSKDKKGNKYEILHVGCFGCKLHIDVQNNTLFLILRN